MARSTNGEAGKDRAELKKTLQKPGPSKRDCIASADPPVEFGEDRSQMPDEYLQRTFTNTLFKSPKGPLIALVAPD